MLCRIWDGTKAAAGLAGMVARAGAAPAPVAAVPAERLGFLLPSLFSPRLALPAPLPCAAILQHRPTRAAAAGELLDKLVSTIRLLAMDAVEKANSGHPGMPMG